MLTYNAVFLLSRNFDAVEVSDWDGVVGSTVYSNGFQVGSFSKRLQIDLHNICRPHLTPILLSIIFCPHLPLAKTILRWRQCKEGLCLYRLLRLRKCRLKCCLSRLCMPNFQWWWKSFNQLPAHFDLRNDQLFQKNIRCGCRRLQWPCLKRRMSTRLRRFRLQLEMQPSVR